jgi:hypothetical protein
MIKILFDFEVKGVEMYMLNLPQAELKVLMDIKGFIYERLRLLEPEAAKQPDAYVVYTIHPSHIDYSKYNDSLAAKMKGEIKERDMAYIKQKLTDLFFPEGL